MLTGPGMYAFLSVCTHSVNYKKPICISQSCTNTNQCLSLWDGGDLLLHVLVVGHAGLAVGPVHEARLHVVVDRAALGGAGGGMPFFRSLFIACVDYKKQICKSY